MRAIDAFSKHVELLRPLVSADGPLHVSRDSATVSERLLLREMKDAEFITCIFRCDEKGVPSDFVNVVITTEGRRLLAEFDAPPEKTWTIDRRIAAYSIVVALAAVTLACIQWLL